MKNVLNDDLIQAIKLELGIEPAFIEKDWYMVQVLDAISKLDFRIPELSHVDVKLVFGGGTSLSKAHKVINRFSEDMDFLVYGDKGLSRNNRRQVKKILHTKIRQMFADFPEYPAVGSGAVFAGNESRYFGYHVPYSKIYDHTTLRAELKIEVAHEATILEPQVQSISSFVSKFLGEPENVRMPCVSAVEIAGNKLSALSWRMLATPPPEPQIMRHVHDLAYLHDTILDNKCDFAKVFAISIQKDQSRTRRARSLKPSVSDTLHAVLDTLHADTYRQNYNTYVLGMSFAKQADIIPFDDAIDRLKTVVNTIQQYMGH